MRSISSVVVIGVMVLLSGCADTKWGFLKSNQETGRVFADTPTSVQLVDVLNQNAQRVQSLDCQYVDLDVKQGIQQFGLRGQMVCQKPRNFRMVANVLGKREADFGSNDQEFWYWIAKGDPYLIHCSYQDLARGNIRMPFPFQPEWVMEALGMAEYDPTRAYKLVPKGNSVELVLDSVNAQGQPIQKVVGFDRAGGRYTVRTHILRDARGKEICTAQITEARNIGNVMVPKQIVLNYPAEKLQLKMKLYDDPRDVVVNKSIERDQALWLFTRPNWEGVQTWNLATGPEAPGGLRPAGGVGPR